jgi:hypothetical protein
MGRLLSADMGHKVILDSVNTAVNADEWRPGGVSQRRLEIEEGIEFRMFASRNEVSLSKRIEGVAVIEPRPNRVWFLNDIRYKESEVSEEMWPVIPQGLVVIRHHIGVTTWEIGLAYGRRVYKVVDGEPWLNAASVRGRGYIRARTRGIPMLLRIPAPMRERLSKSLYRHYEQALKSAKGADRAGLEGIRGAMRLIRKSPS